MLSAITSRCDERIVGVTLASRMVLTSWIASKSRSMVSRVNNPRVTAANLRDKEKKRGAASTTSLLSRLATSTARSRCSEVSSEANRPRVRAPTTMRAPLLKGHENTMTSKTITRQPAAMKSPRSSHNCRLG
jgi:hypothetical protein